ncbi:MAG: signal peptidase I [Clostridia bacterium]|nr:signal peptidase I [Clostridia bacterium]
MSNETTKPNENTNTKIHNILREIISWTCHIAAAIVIALIINIFIFQPTQVQGSSMESTLHERDKVLLNKLSHTFKSVPDYEDIVVIDSRVDRARSLKDDFTDSFKYNLISYKLFNVRDEIYWVKRVIGKAGDTLEFQNGKVVRNGKVLDEPYIKEPMEYSSDEKIVVPEGAIFVMGDNRNHSQDSRHIGPIPIDHVIGKYIVKF